jgi:formate-dependent nitrite reductase membrane component NrfD
MTVKSKDNSTTEWLPDFTPSADIVKMATAKPATSAPADEREGYYGVPLLKRPKWRWEIAFYFFFEGISAGSFLLGALAGLSGNKRLRELTRAAYDVSFLTLLPCPPLLIADLGRPERFHHMLRVFKPMSPMNLGAWTLAGFSAPVTAITALRLIGDGSLIDQNKLVLRSVLGAVGLPFALIMISYPGVLLSTTSTPVWSRSRFLGALFACSSIGNGAAATSFALSLRNGSHNVALERLAKIENTARICEGAALVAYLVTSKDAARPLTKGRHSLLFWLGAIGCGLLLPVVFTDNRKHNKDNKRSPGKSIVRSVLSLAGGLALKWAITHAGRESADDVQATRNATRPNKNAPGWGPA